MNDAEVAWLAGIMEGEACFDWARTKERAYPRIRLEMKDKDIIDRVLHLIGGRCWIRERPGKKENHATTYVLAITNKEDVQRVLKLIEPWLGERRKERVTEIVEESHWSQR
jgi:hypothetical protein